MLVGFCFSVEENSRVFYDAPYRCSANVGDSWYWLDAQFSGELAYGGTCDFPRFSRITVDETPTVAWSTSPEYALADGKNSGEC